MNIPERQPVLTVSELTRSIKKILEKDYRFVRISGEISNLKTPFSGHSYFILKDDSAQIRAVLFKQQKRFVDTKLQDGQQVICFGRLTVYEPRGDYQLILDSVEPLGTGQLQREFERLKQKLETKGYFDSKRKKEIPRFAKKIAVISSPTGAAFADFLKIVELRQSKALIQLLPVRVQGDEAPGEIARAISAIDSGGNHDVIVLCRGGGSLEDLWAFNDERVANAIFRASIPIVCGVGHEIDFTIADFCADFRSPTPTAAAEKLLPDNSLLLHQIDRFRVRLTRHLQQHILVNTQQLRHNLKMLGNMSTLVREAEQRVQSGKSFLFQALVNSQSEKERRLANLSTKLQGQAPMARVTMHEHRLLHLKKILVSLISRTTEKKQAELGTQAALLNSVSPLATLGRGYSITRQYDPRKKEYRLIRKSCEVSPGDSINVLLAEGSLDCQVIEEKN